MLMALLLVASVAITGSATVAAQEEDEAEDVSVGDIMDDPSGFAGEDVTISGPIGGELDREAFTIEEDGEELLVVGDRGTVPSDLPDEVDVTGTVEEEFNIGDVEDELGIRLNDRQLDEFEGEPFIMADDIVEATDEPADDAAELDRVGVGAVVADFETYVMQQVAVAGQVEDILSEEAMVISSDESNEANVEMLVLASDRAIPAQLNENAITEVMGTLYVFDPEDEAFLGELEDEGIGVDPDDELFTEYVDQPVLVATSVTLLVPSLGETIDFILDDPEAYIGATVNLFGRVADDYAPAGFTLEGTDSFFGGEDLMVIGADDVLTPLPLEEETIVNVRGTVYYFDPIAIEEEEGFEIDEEDDAFADLDEGDPVVVADSVTELATDPGETVEDIIENSDDFVGLSVAVAGNINEVLTDQAFTFEGTDGFLGVGGDDLLVIGAQGALPEEALNDDVIVFVTGTVYYYDPVEIEEEEEDLDFDEDDSAFDDFDDGDVVIVADRVTPLVVVEDN